MESSVRPSPIASEPVGGSNAESVHRGRWTTPPVGSPVRLRLDLQRRAQDNLRRHVRRGASRFLVLVIADLASFAVMREVIRLGRDTAFFGFWFSTVAQSFTPAGVLNGWQYASALFVSLALLGCYRAGDRRRDPRRLFLAAALATALPLWMTIWIRGPGVVLLEYGVTTILVWAGIVFERLVVDRIVMFVRPPEETAARTLFVGTTAEYAAVTAMPAFQGRRDYWPVGFVDVQVPPSPDALGHLVELARVIHDAGAETVVVCGRLNDGQLAEVTNAALAAECQLLTLPHGADIPGLEPGIVWRRGQPLIELTAPTLKGWQVALKRAIDVIGAGLGLLIAAPVMLALAIAIRLDSPGAVFFRQERVGFGGRVFKMFKFRTMTEGADEVKARLAHLNRSGDPRLFKILDDPRVTNLGRWLRRWSLDELPQLWNVLAGDMSLVGPRPFFESDLPNYDVHHFARLGAKPGITGLWQVSGRSDIVNFEEVVALDTVYIRTWSVIVDLGILLKTLPAVLRRRGAA